MLQQRLQRQTEWTSQRTSSIYLSRSLENEIFALRMKMEKAFLEHQSLTSGPVIEMSRKLDQKINEYMNGPQRAAH